jgi:Growth inhibitor
MKRNDIVFLKCSAVESNGSVQNFDRPAVIIQNNMGNEHSTTLIVAYLTSQIKRMDMPTHVVLSGYQLYKPSMLMAEQIATVSKSDVVAVIDHLRPEDVAKVNYAIFSSLDLQEVS